MGRVFRPLHCGSCPLTSRLTPRAEPKQTDDQQAVRPINEQKIPDRLILPAPHLLTRKDIAVFSKCFAIALSEIPRLNQSANKSLLFMHLMANTQIATGNRKCTPATSPCLPAVVQCLLTLSQAGMVRIIGEQRLRAMHRMERWNDYAGIWIVALDDYSIHQIVDALKSASRESADVVCIQPWGIRYPCRHKKSNPRLKPKPQRARGALEPEPDTALAKQDRYFTGYTSRTDESGCAMTFSLTFATAGGQGSIDAAVGTRKHAKARWRYGSTESFVNADGKPWSDLGLKTFNNATAKLGVVKWLTWLIQHTAIPTANPGVTDQDEP
eukprot:jgi/Ulvmu1/9136/UM005_0234.1